MSELVKSMLEASVAELTPKPIDVDTLARVYVKMRNARQALKRRWEKEDKDIEAKQEIIATAMLRFLNDHKLDSTKTESGTVYKQEELVPTGADWDAFYRWIAENNAFDALERRIKKTFIKEYMDDHKNAIPPGVSVFRRYVIRVRKGQTKSEVVEDETGE